MSDTRIHVHRVECTRVEPACTRVLQPEDPRDFEEEFMRRLSLLVCFAAAIFAAPLAAHAQRAWAIDGAQIYAGPGNDYPIVARLAPGVAVRVQGCLSDYSWCDVTFGGNRGWVYAGELGYAYDNRRVPIVDYGPRIGLPIVTFSLGNYWDHYYRGRPWYRERDHWEHRTWNRDDHQRYENNWRERNEQRNDWRQDNNRRYERYDNRGRNDNPTLQNDGRGGYGVRRNPNAGPSDQPGSAPNYDNGAGHQQ
jgi:uncharacterized protein YraI